MACGCGVVRQRRWQGQLDMTLGQGDVSGLLEFQACDLHEVAT